MIGIKMKKNRSQFCSTLCDGGCVNEPDHFSQARELISWVRDWLAHPAKRLNITPEGWALTRTTQFKFKPSKL